MGKRGKAKKTRQLGKIQKKILKRLLVLRLTAARDESFLTKQEIKQFGIPYSLLTTGSKRAFLHPKAPARDIRPIEGNVSRAVSALEERGLITARRTAAGTRTHLKLTATGTRVAKRFYMISESERDIRKTVRSNWEIRYGEYESWPPEKRKRFEQRVKDIERQSRDLGDNFVAFLALDWTSQP